jgi:sulfonate transport system ATP-binding protein
MAAAPGRIDREYRVARPWPRDRRDPVLADLRGQVLERLDAFEAV